VCVRDSNRLASDRESLDGCPDDVCADAGVIGRGADAYLNVKMRGGALTLLLNDFLVFRCIDARGCGCACEFVRKSDCVCVCVICVFVFGFELRMAKALLCVRAYATSRARDSPIVRRLFLPLPECDDD